MSMMPGMNTGAMKNVQLDEKQMQHTEAIVLSMTPAERHDPRIINGSRRKRIAAGCGLTVEEVNALLRQFEQMKKLMKQLSGAGGKMKLPGRFGKMQIPGL